jgi:hypothetical protein
MTECGDCTSLLAPQWRRLEFVSASQRILSLPGSLGISRTGGTRESGSPPGFEGFSGGTGGTGGTARSRPRCRRYRCDRVVPRVQYRSVPPRDVSFPRSTACTACTPSEYISLSATNNFAAVMAETTSHSNPGLMAALYFGRAHHLEDRDNLSLCAVVRTS